MARWAKDLKALLNDAIQWCNHDDDGNDRIRNVGAIHGSLEINQPTNPPIAAIYQEPQSNAYCFPRYLIPVTFFLIFRLQS